MLFLATIGPKTTLDINAAEILHRKPVNYDSSVGSFIKIVILPEKHPEGKLLHMAAYVKPDGLL